MGELEFACVIYCILKSIIVTTVPHLSFKTTLKTLTLDERRLNRRLTNIMIFNPPARPTSIGRKQPLRAQSIGVKAKSVQ